jgi:hypothetical protein
MADSDRDRGKNDNAAKTIATIALILAIIALIWARKADNRAGDALDKANSSTSSSMVQQEGRAT